MFLSAPERHDPLAALQTLVLEFRQCLMQESEALAAWPPLDLWSVQTEKVRLVRDLESAHERVAAWLTQQGRDLKDLDSLPADMRQRWDSVREALADCQQRNLVNARCLARQQQALRQSLDLLVSKLDQDLTYGRRGHCQGGRRLGSIGLA